MKVDIPGHVQIGGHTITVHQVEDKTLYPSVRGKVIGEWDSLQNRITLANTDNVDVSWENFYHEVVEAINTTYELNLPHPTITSLAAGLWQVNRGVYEANGISVI